MRRLLFVFYFSLFTLNFSLFPLSTFAEAPEKGFYAGPYITIGVGLIDFDWDINQRTNVQEGANKQAMFHLGYGWNLNDWLAPELQIRYGNDSNSGRREHIVGMGAGFNFTLPWKPLISFDSLRILPFFRPAFVFQVASLPGDTTATDNRVTSPGWGGSISGGLRFLFHEYLYFGFEVENDWIHHVEVFQNLSGMDTLIYRGGWKEQLEMQIMVGVHF